MYISLKDYKTLSDIYSSLMFDESVSSELVDSLGLILKELEQKRQVKNKYNAETIKEKRKTNKFYATSYERKNKMLGI